MLTASWVQLPDEYNAASPEYKMVVLLDIDSGTVVQRRLNICFSFTLSIMYPIRGLVVYS